ncbi:winged helix-turn-helix transcriptional regulator [Photobacterium sp. GJ3]|uniref:winged helix-turn-helix domain-containing protein n=1 Tax=Photobacterium sp. GJ3 TaxID=2829502 RepID=UPI001B8D7B1C|nr:winged helix-turn-helix domain-containing protein [Photobacterium sp. GJ3]QUJ66616.1 winged helix-turn-helix transcriptional regulator [Photobacterium sp. GJ3]
MNHIVYIDSSTRKLSCHDKVSESALAPSEILILKVLSLPDARDGISRDEIIAYAWPGKVVTKNSLNVAMNNIRNTLNELNIHPSIVTLRGFGYQLHHSLVIHQDDNTSNIESDNRETIAVNQVELKKIPQNHQSEVERISAYVSICQKLNKAARDSLNGYRFTAVLMILISLTVAYYYQINLL